MDIEQTANDQLLGEARKQTAALESLRGIALVWSAFAALGLVVWIFFVLAH